MNYRELAKKILDMTDEQLSSEIAIYDMAHNDMRKVEHIMSYQPKVKDGGDGILEDRHPYLTLLPLK